jgi:hypothetical protein
MAAEVGVFVVTSGIVLINVALILWFQPYTVRREWKKPVKMMALLVTLTSAVSNLVCAAYQQGAVSVLAADASSFSVFGCIVLLIVAFLLCFWRAAWLDTRHYVVMMQKQGGTGRRKSHVFMNNPLVPLLQQSPVALTSLSVMGTPAEPVYFRKRDKKAGIGERVFTTRILRAQEGKQAPNYHPYVHGFRSLEV